MTERETDKQIAERVLNTPTVSISNDRCQSERIDLARRLLAADAKLKAENDYATYGISVEKISYPSTLKVPDETLDHSKSVSGMDRQELEKLNEPVVDIKVYNILHRELYAEFARPEKCKVVKYEDHLQAMRARVPDQPMIYEDGKVRPLIPEGYVLVPVEPTEVMIAAALRDCGYCTDDLEEAAIEHRVGYTAMLAAAPKPDQDSVSSDTKE